MHSAHDRFVLGSVTEKDIELKIVSKASPLLRDF
jgi:hypothetical protein